MKIEKDAVIFSTGKTRYANFGIIGLSPDMKVTEGYDGGFFYGDEWADEKDKLTNEELIELADYMIELWNKFRSSKQ